MIAHIVLFDPRPDLSDADRTELLRALTTASKDIPQIRRFQVGRRVLHGLPGYEQAMRDSYEFAAIVEFDTVDDLRSYLRHPAHLAMGRHFAESSARALAYDYEVAHAATAADLLGTSQ